MAKQFGLIKPSNVFGSDSEDESNSTAVKKQPVLKPNLLQKKQIQKMHEQAVEEDPNIFLYDEVYDDIQNKRNEAKNQKKSQEEKKPKYIKKLIETAEKRKKEYERRVERQVQKDREAEGEKYKDKEIFVTSTYRKKLEEIKEAELEEKRQEYLESIGDVTKQADLSGFYRHLYSQKLDTGPEEVKAEKPEDVNSKPEEPNTKRINDTSHKKKNYRKRESSNDEEPTVSETADSKPAKTEHLNSNLDADSDFSVDSSSEESDSENKEKQGEKKIPKEDITFKEPMKPVEKVEVQEPVDTDKIEDEIEEVEVEPKKPKIDIWAKRTVGDSFVEAVKRYYERKAMKESGMS
jgi:coiled-coil domain-containing protein 55